MAVDGAGNVYIADTGNNAIKKWTAANNTVTTLVSSGLNMPQGVAVDGAGNVYIADTGNNAIKELPHAFVDPTAKLESAGRRQRCLAVVLPATANLLGPFAPTSDQPWLTITGITNGVVSFAFTANRCPTARPISPCSARPFPSRRVAPTYSLGTTALLEGPAAGSDSVVLAVTPRIPVLDGHGECRLAAS